MERKEKELLEELCRDNEELRRCVEEHADFERRLEELHRRPYLTPEELIQEKQMKKMKLIRKDKIEKILAQHR